MNIDHVKTWTNCLSLIKDNITAQAFKTWFEPIVPVKIPVKNKTASTAAKTKRIP